MNSRATWKRLFRYTSQYRKITIGAVICAILSVIASLIGPLLIGRAVDHMIGPDQVDFPGIFRLLLILGAIYLIGSFFGWLLTYYTNKLAYRTVYDLRRELFDKLDALPLKFHDNHPQGDSISRFVNDMDAVSDGLLQGFSTLLTGIVTIAGAIGLMLYISPVMTLVVLLSAPATFFVARFITMRSQQMFREQAKILGGLNGYVEELVGGQKVVQAYHYEDRSFAGFAERIMSCTRQGSNHSSTALCLIRLHVW